jgi:hypothetical protein
LRSDPSIPWVIEHHDVLSIDLYYIAIIVGMGALCELAL